jgi:predicted acetyltransferase
MADLAVRDLTSDDHDAALAVRIRSFGPLPAEGAAWWDNNYERAIAARRALGVFVGDQLAAMARIHAYRQLWGGRPLPMAGVAGVVVAPEWRGRGVARLLMTTTLERAVELGDVLSALFPSVSPPYRRLGWEMAGSVSRTTFPADAIRRIGAPEVVVRRATLNDTDQILALIQREDARSRACGPLALNAEDIRELLEDDDNFCYLADDGFLAYAWDGADLRVERLLAESADTTRALWALAGSGASIAKHVYTYAPQHDPIHWLLDAQADHQVQEERWMLRVLDAPAAIAGRRFPAGVDIDVPLSLHDAWLPSCAGSYRLRVDDERGELTPAQPSTDAVVLGPNGLAALYAGTPMHTLRAAGLATMGISEADAQLDAAFASRCYLIDSF